MIAGHFHEGSGLGNQLHRYIFTRVKALDLGVPFGMYGTFKGEHFIQLDKGVIPEGITKAFEEERINNEQEVDVRPYDKRIELIEDNTVVDGEFQDEKYFEYRLDEVRGWLKVEPLELPDDLCIINFRGGEYKGVRDLYLTKDYWKAAVECMQEIGIHKFEVHTDDPEEARRFFPDYPIISDMALNWRSIRYAKYLILSNSSFAILPALLGDAKTILAPIYWAGRNVGYWKMVQNKYKRFTYI